MRHAPATRILLVSQILIAMLVLATAGGTRLALLAAIAAGSVLVTRWRLAVAASVGTLVAAAIAVLAVGHAGALTPRPHTTAAIRSASYATSLRGGY